VSRAALAALGAVALAAAAYAVAFPTRSDYAGHFLAGAGGTLLLLALAALTGRGGPWRAVAVAAVAVALGTVAEATVFRLAELDPVDLANQSLGGLLVAAGHLDATRRDVPVAAATALVLLAAGFVVAFA
jgi:hypothetical protein